MKLLKVLIKDFIYYNIRFYEKNKLKYKFNINKNSG